MYKISKLWPILLLLSTIIFNEFLIYYFKIGFTCDWPDIRSENNTLKAFMIADTHLLGIYRGHWLDKLKREWQMKMAHRAGISLLSPDVVFFLGDLLDEGKWSNEQLFNEYSQQFNELFSTDVPTYSLAGNHDLGFHYEFNPHIVNWFQKNFNRTLVDSVTIKGNHFIFVNSMSFHGDGCYLCNKAEAELEEISRRLNCSKNETCTAPETFTPYRRPILLLHFPLYRENESECLRDEEFDNSAPKRDEAYRPKWESLSQEATRKLIKALNPRAVFNGHSHRGCKKKWIRPSFFWEYTVNSFSWRNGNRPTFLMAVVTDKEVEVRTCFLPNESTTFVLYIAAAIATIGWLVVQMYYTCKYWIRGEPRKHPSYCLISEAKENKCD